MLLKPYLFLLAAFRLVVASFCQLAFLRLVILLSPFSYIVLYIVLYVNWSKAEVTENLSLKLGNIAYSLER